MTYTAYKMVHLVGIMLLFLSLGGMVAYRLLGPGVMEGRPKRILMALHGVALFVILFGGFGLMARLGIPHGDWPTWIQAKAGLWLVLGATVVLIKRAPLPWYGHLCTVLALGGTAAWFAIFKP